MSHPLHLPGQPREERKGRAAGCYIAMLKGAVHSTLHELEPWPLPLSLSLIGSDLLHGRSEHGGTEPVRGVVGEGHSLILPSNQGEGQPV
jgi:hypothetical protein